MTGTARALVWVLGAAAGLGVFLLLDRTAWFADLHWALQSLTRIVLAGTAFTVVAATLDLAGSRAGREPDGGDPHGGG